MSYRWQCYARSHVAGYCNKHRRCNRNVFADNVVDRGLDVRKEDVDAVSGFYYKKRPLTNNDMENRRAYGSLALIVKLTLTVSPISPSS